MTIPCICFKIRTVADMDNLFCLPLFFINFEPEITIEKD